ncbi:GSCFA domain-containing protein [Antarcticibacterium arcticum]|uniref:GSCFA domain-containing protein n=1 Tax=Antarcticibacterium arcticum TaxID=2585771 RepID=A0A5B8YIC6_9FLAO|nr:GSCFA domain-containing protein [Antarcticibacterium arcticum]QED37574.1 GSCFA domain-containing protein [Antarcticibacterium arcticum]
MKLTTPVPVKPQDPKIDHNSKIFLLGSCFVENIGEQLDYYKFQNFRNPFGILYHPLILEQFILRAEKGFAYTEEDIFFHNERWHSFAAHSVLSDPEKDRFLNRLNEQSLKSLEFLKYATHIILTLGTSWVYKTRESNEAVANCHKLPQHNFHKEITSVEELESSLQSLISSLKRLNGSAQIIFTISPVRHLKDGVVENQQSKAHLISALHQVLNIPEAPAVYFPSYEIMIDELRDYRFYAEDMLHPNATAIRFIWYKFITAWCTEETVNILKEIEQIQRGLSHRPFNKNSLAHQNFLSDLKNKIELLISQFPHINFKEA